MKTLPAGIYMFKVNDGNTRKLCEIGSKLRIKTPEQRHWCHSGIFMLNLNRFHTFFWCFHRWLWTSKFQIGRKPSVNLVDVKWKNLSLKTIKVYALSSLLLSPNAARKLGKKRHKLLSQKHDVTLDNTKKLNLLCERKREYRCHFTVQMGPKVRGFGMYYSFTKLHVIQWKWRRNSTKYRFAYSNGQKRLYC